MKLTKIVSSVGTTALAIGLGLSLQYALADWSGAPSNPPSNNAAAPLNVSSSFQAKSGGLTLGSSIASSSIPLDVEGIGYLQSLILGKDSGATFEYLDGNQGAGKVLTSDASGNATWQSPASTTGVTKIIAGTNVTISPTGGTGNVTINSSPGTVTTFENSGSGASEPLTENVQRSEYSAQCPAGEAVVGMEQFVGSTQTVLVCSALGAH